MADWLNCPEAELVIGLAVIAAMVAVGVYVSKKIRAESVQQEPTASDLLSKFRDLHSQGDLSDLEFRTIRTTLAARLTEELKDNDETG
jgi:hypothetical protein